MANGFPIIKSKDREFWRLRCRGPRVIQSSLSDNSRQIILHSCTLTRLVYSSFSMLEKLHIFFATGFYSGYLKPFSGTWGSGAAVIAWILIGKFIPNYTNTYDICFIAFLIFAGVYSTNVLLRAVESGAIPAPKKPNDPSIVVIDEWAGTWITLLGTARGDYIGIVIAFIIFRALDIIKPPPVRQLEQFPKGLGIMLDDVAAGIIGLIALSVLRYYAFIPSPV